MKIIITEEQLTKINNDLNKEKIVCENCGWSWDISEGGDDLYTCHKCGHVNSENNKQ